MMAQQDSPVMEALALNYLTFGFQSLANNLWVWITALTTAAITLWGTHTSTASPQDQPPTTTVEDEQFQLVASSLHAAPPASIFDACDAIGRTSGKFAVYFSVSEEDEDEEEEEEIEMEVGLEGQRESGKFAVYFSVSEEDEDEKEEEEIEMEVGLEGQRESGTNSSFCEEDEWEKRLRMRMDLSWYRFQDLTAMNGNVVKVWDGRPNYGLSSSYYY